MQIKSLNPAESASDLAAAAARLPTLQPRDEAMVFPSSGRPGFAYLGSGTGPDEWNFIQGAFADEQAVEAEGMAFYGGQLEENLDLAWLDFVVTPPRQTRWAPTTRCSRRPRSVPRNWAASGWPWACLEAFDPAAFAEKFTDGKVSTDTLDPARPWTEIDRAAYKSWAAPSEKNARYSLVQWTDHCPDDLAESFCKAMDAMHDQPMGALAVEWVENNVRRLRDDEEFTRLHGLRRNVLAALDADGDVAGFNIIRHDVPDEPEPAEIWDTGVVRAHRGHGLGLRIKAAAGLWLLETQPSARWVRRPTTTTNKWMIDVNRAARLPGEARPVPQVRVPDRRLIGGASPRRPRGGRTFLSGAFDKRIPGRRFGLPDRGVRPTRYALPRRAGSQSNRLAPASPPRP